ncbi:MAG: PilZ domain-containing protein [Desulfobulbaceae bacterium]|jgi:hypothetical protein|nr:PilZ domain-containing protein [Desulfobulbaceae bacterium]
MTNVKVHVREDNTATLVCPACGAVKLIAADKFKLARHTLKVKCRCQETFNVLFDFRRHYRKQVSLPGTYEIISQGGVGGGIIHLNNLSRGGIGFTVSGLHQVKKDQVLLIEFQLNDKKKTVLKKKVLVITVEQNLIGCQFENNVEMEKDLGFFLKN